MINKINYYDFNWWLYREEFINKKEFLANRKFIKTLPSEIGNVIMEEGKTINSGLFFEKKQNTLF